MLWDTHTHSRFSGDSGTSPEETVRAAFSKNLGGICFTDHLDLDYPDEPGIFDLDIPSYLKKIGEIRRTYESRFPVLCGVEIGLQPHLAGTHRTIVSGCPFDFVIGSSHVIHGADPYYPSFFDGRTDEEAYAEYFSSIAENIRAFDDFDVYGHLDYIIRYGKTKNRFYRPKQYKDTLDEILRLLIQRDKGLEVNTAGFRAGLSAPNPSTEILARFRELGGKIVTIGSDAHNPNDVGADFERVPAILKKAGFSEFAVFRGREPVFYKL